MKFSEFPQEFRFDAVSFWIGAAHSIARTDVQFPCDQDHGQWAREVACKADALTTEFMSRLLPENR